MIKYSPKTKKSKFTPKNSILNPYIHHYQNSYLSPIQKENIKMQSKITVFKIFKLKRI